MIELKIDREFEELIPPLTEEEYKGLENNILENGFNPAFPIITWNGLIIDGHNRYSVCSRHGIEFKTIEQDFASRSAVLMWIMDNQLARRNINLITRKYLTGRRYKEEKKSAGGDRKSKGSNFLLKTTAEQIGAQVGMSDRGVKDAEKFAEAVDTLTENTGISRALLISGAVNVTQKDVIELATKYDVDFQVEVIKEVTDKAESDIKNSIRKIKQRRRDREIQEQEEKKRQLAEQLRLEREEKERQEKERLRKEREEKERLEAERLEKEKAEKERLRLIREEEARVAREKYEAEKAEKERLRLERLEKERIEREKQAAERAERERIAREKLEAEKKEAERLRQIRLEEERVAREKAAKERAEQKRLADEEAERKRQERLKLEAEERERKRIEAEKKEAERREKLRLEEERLEKERIENEKLEAERKEKERIEREKLEAERLEAERLRKIQEEKDRIEREKLEAERLEREKEAQIKLEQFKAEQARIEQEKLAQFKAEQERIEQERLQAVIASELEEEIDKKFDVILCDPPWRYDFAETKNREIENQYPTMDLEEIKALAVPAADDCVLFMWATAPKLEQAFEVLRAWGFTYKTCAVWDKEKIGMGYWFRGQHELLLVGTRGNPGAPQPENRYSSVIRVKREGHSKKPECVYEMIEKMMPACSYLEMFARNKREKWSVWGNQV